MISLARLKSSLDSCGGAGSGVTDIEVLLYGEIMLIFISERRAHPPLPAWPVVSYGFRVLVTANHLNGTAGSGWMARLVVPIFYAGAYHAGTLPPTVE